MKLSPCLSAALLANVVLVVSSAAAQTDERLLPPPGVVALASGVDRRAVPVERIGVAGVSIALPPGWHAMPRSAQPSQNDPVTRIVASSGQVWFGKGCSDVDYEFPRTAVAIVLVEWVQPTPWARYAPRPQRFTAKTLPVRPPPALKCFNGPGGGVTFSENGWRYVVGEPDVWFGKIDGTYVLASTVLAKEDAFRALESLAS